MNGFAEHLYGNDLEGYVQVLQFEDKKIKIYNTSNDGIKEVIEEKENQTDVFITPNTMYIPKRDANNIRQFRALYVDIDNIEGGQLSVAYEVFELAEKNLIPKPSMIIDSGRGIHLYWRIKNAPYSAIYTWQNIEDMLIYRLKHLGADSKASDSARVLRIPNTINSRNNAKSRVLYIDDSIEYSMFDIKENYLNKYKKNQVHRAKREHNKLINNLFFNSYSLHISRSNDILKLCKLRNYNVKGYRNMILHCYAYWQGIYIRDNEELENKVLELNSMFKEPLNNREVKAILRCIPKAINKFIEYEQGKALGENKKVSSKMKDRGGYWYKNETLIERLDITEKEQERLETIISANEKYRRRNIKRTPRNEQGLTKKQEEIKLLEQKVNDLLEKGYTKKEVMKKLNLSRSTMYRISKNEK